MSTTLLKSIALGVVTSYIETKYIADTPLGSSLYETTTASLPRGVGLTSLVLIFTYFWMIYYGFAVVGKARGKYRELAKKDGEKNADRAYGFPHLYVMASDSKHALAFNCVQRSHQQIMETLPGYLVVSLISAVHFPLTASLLCSLWLYSRMVWAAGYANDKGDASQRYSHPFSRFFWQATLALIVLSTLSSVNLVAGKKIFWDEMF